MSDICCRNNIRIKSKQNLEQLEQGARLDFGWRCFLEAISMQEQIDEEIILGQKIVNRREENKQKTGNEL